MNRPELMVEESLMNNRATIPDAEKIAELIALHEFSELAFAQTEEELARNSVEKVTRLFGPRYFAVLSGRGERQRMVVDFGFQSVGEVLSRLSERTDSDRQFLLIFNEGTDDQDIVFLEQDQRIDDRTRRNYALCARRLEYRLNAFRLEAQRKKAEEELGNNYALLRMAGKSALLGGWLVNLTENRVVWSDEVADIHDMPAGYSPLVEEGISFYAPEWHEKIKEVFGKCVTQGIPYDEIMEIVTAKGRRRWVRTIGEAARDSTGKITKIHGSFQDITARQHAEAYRPLSGTVVAALNSALTFKDGIREVLGAIKHATGCDAVGMRLRNGEDFPYLEEDGFSCGFVLAENSLLSRDEKGDVCRNADGTPRYECTCGLVLTGQTDSQNPLFTPGGSAWTNNSFPFLDVPASEDPRLHPRNRCIHEGYASVALVPIRTKNGIVGILQLNGRTQDLFTRASIEALEGVAAHIGGALQRLEAEEQLKTTNAFLDSIIENIPTMLFLKEAQNLRFVRFNRAGEQITGFQRDDLLGKNDYDLFPKEQADFFVQKDRETLLQKNGTEVEEEPLQSVHNGLRILHTRKVPIVNKEGEPQFLLGISEDVTERKKAEAEQEQLRSQLHHVHMMESIGQLAAGIAHEINTPIQFVGDNLGFLKDAFANLQNMIGRCGDLIHSPPSTVEEWVRLVQTAMEESDVNYLKGEVPKALEQSEEGIRRVSKIVHALKEFSHPERGEEKGTVDINRALESTIIIARNEWKYVAELSTHLDPELPMVDGYSGVINQVFLNLIVNAAHAIGEKKGDGIERGLIDISTRLIDNWAEIRVSDTGTGIEEKNRSRVFKPFFTTKSVGKGTGQGLAMAYQAVVKQHGGSLTFETQVGQGTTFIVRLPIRVDNHESA